MPGANSSSVYGGEGEHRRTRCSSTASTRATPKAAAPGRSTTTTWSQEVQIQGLGAPAEYGGFTGAVVNTITKSGGNRYSGLFDILGTQQQPRVEQRHVRHRRAESGARLAGGDEEVRRFHDAARRADQAGQAVLLLQRAALPAGHGSERSGDDPARGQPALQREAHVAADGERQLHAVAAVRRLQHHRPRGRVGAARHRRAHEP